MKIGFFGKLPGYGDFIQRNIKPETVKQWDNWLLQSIESSLAQLGKSWRDIYFNSPIWRFEIESGLMGETQLSGVMMPSVDGAGRCYPFTVFCQVEQKVNLFTLSSNIAPMHEQCEEIILSLLEKNRPDLDEVLSILESCYQTFDENEYMDMPLTYTPSSMELLRTGYSAHQACHNAFTLDFLANHGTKISIWSTAETENITGQHRYYQGLPPTDVFTSLIVGQ